MKKKHILIAVTMLMAITMVCMTSCGKGHSDEEQGDISALDENIELVDGSNAIILGDVLELERPKGYSDPLSYSPEIADGIPASIVFTEKGNDNKMLEVIVTDDNEAVKGLYNSVKEGFDKGRSSETLEYGKIESAVGTAYYKFCKDDTKTVQIEDDEDDADELPGITAIIQIKGNDMNRMVQVHVEDFSAEDEGKLVFRKIGEKDMKVIEDYIKSFSLTFDPSAPDSDDYA